jgi:hypothetical protein
MVNGQEQDTRRQPANQGVHDVAPEPNRIGASTPYDFEAKNLTAYGGRSWGSVDWWKKP